MSGTSKQRYSADAHIAEIYDQVETQTDDVALIRRLIGPRRNLSIFEPFCGKGRILIPLAKDGHLLIGLDEAEAMLERLRQELEGEPQVVRDRVQLICSPVFAVNWPEQQDVVILGGNCFYEMNSSDEQRALVHRAAGAVRGGGHVFIDNDDHRSPELSPEWRKPPGEVRRAFPSGTCQDGTRLEGSTETTWYDTRCRLVHYVRRLKVTHPNGEIVHHQWEETCHPIVMEEVTMWAQEAGFVVEQTFGDKKGSPYEDTSPRALIWARRD
jgi:hypothetical protein